MVKSPVLSDAERAEVEESIAAAEAATGAEFVVVIARRSSRYERAADLFGLLVGVALLTLASIIFPPEPRHGAWTVLPHVEMSLPAVLLVFLGGTLLGAFLATIAPALSRPFRTRGEMRSQVRRRAADCFTDFRLRDAGGSGVLIYLSLLERQLWVTGDDSLEKRTGPELWARARDTAVAALSRDRIAEALSSALRHLAEGIAPHLPPRPDREGRLPNTVREIA